jgi:hypothetical protein
MKGQTFDKIKNRIMKKILFIGTMFLVLSACNGNVTDSAKDETKDGTLVNIGSEKTPIYSMTLEAEDGDKSTKKVKFYIDNLIVQKLKLTESKIRNICDNGIRYADWNVKFKPTYKTNETASLSYDKEANRIIALMSGTAENAYGVPDNINTIIPFDVNGKMIEDKDGIPEIY